MNTYIFAAFNKKDLLSLLAANAYRGIGFISVSSFNIETEDHHRVLTTAGVYLSRKNFNTNDIDDADFYIGAIVGETETTDFYMALQQPIKIYPNGNDVSLLWMSGELTTQDREKLVSKFGCVNDAMLVLKGFTESDANPLRFLSDLQSDLACVMMYGVWNGFKRRQELKMTLFRTKNAPLYIGSGLLSSVPTALTPNKLKPDRLYSVDFEHDVSPLHITEIGRFY